MAELRRRLGLSRATISVAIERLVELGLARDQEGRRGSGWEVSLPHQRGITTHSPRVSSHLPQRQGRTSLWEVFRFGGAEGEVALLDRRGDGPRLVAPSRARHAPWRHLRRDLPIPPRNTVERGRPVPLRRRRTRLRCREVQDGRCQGLREAPVGRHVAVRARDGHEHVGTRGYCHCRDDGMSSGSGRSRPWRRSITPALRIFARCVSGAQHPEIARRFSSKK